MEAYKVWASLEIKGNALKTMKEFAALTKAASKEVTKLSDQLSHFSKYGLEIKSLSRSFSGISRSVTNSSSRIENFSRIIDKSISNIEALTNANEKLASSFSAVKANSSGFVGSSSRGGAHSSHGLGAHLIRHGREFGMGALVGPTGLLMGAGGAAGMAGVAIGAGALAVGHLAVGGFNQRSQFERAFAMLGQQGTMTPSQMQQARALAINTNMPGISQVDMMQAILDSVMATRNFGDAKNMFKTLAKAKFGANSLFGGMTNKQEMDAIRFAELMGGSNEKKQQYWLHQAFRMNAASAGTLMPSQQLTFARIGAGALGRLSGKGFMSLEPVFQEMGTRTGTALTTLINLLAQGGAGSNFAKYRVQDLAKLGIVSPKYDPHGRPLGFTTPRSILDKVTSDPYSFMQFYLSRLSANGTNIQDAGAVQQRMTLDFPRTAAGVMYSLYKNTQKEERMRSQYMHAGNVESVYRQSLNIPTGKINRLEAAWNKVQFSFARFSNPAVIAGMDKLSSFLEWSSRLLGSMTNAHLADSNGYTSWSRALVRKLHIPQSWTQPWGNPNSSNDKDKTNSAPVNVNLNVDGKKLAQVIVPYLTNAIAKTNISSATGYTQSFTPTPPNLVQGIQ